MARQPRPAGSGTLSLGGAIKAQRPTRMTNSIAADIGSSAIYALQQRWFQTAFAAATDRGGLSFKIHYFRTVRLSADFN